MYKILQKQRRGKNNMQFKAFLEVFFLSLILMLTQISFTSAFEFDNIKEYNNETLTATIINSFGFGEEIAKTQLITPIHNKIAIGSKECKTGIDCKVGEFIINLSDEEYNNALQEMEFFDLNKEMHPINKNFNYKKRINNGFEEIIEYNNSCFNSGYYPNGSEIIECENIILNSYNQTKYIYENLDSNDLLKGEITIGIFTDVKDGDYIEWIPTFFGVEIEEWADFTGYNIYESYSGSQDDMMGSYDNTQYSEQTFTVGCTGLNESFVLKGVEVMMYVSGCDVGETFNMYIFNVSSNGHSNVSQIVASNLSIDCQSINSINGDTQNFTFSSEPILEAGKRYSFAFKTNEAAAHAMNPWFQIDDPPQGYSACGNSSKSSDSGVTWTKEIGSASSYFRIWGTPEIGSITTTLITPTDNFKTNKTNINFNVSSEPIGLNLTNITLYIWNSTNEYHTNTITLSGNETVYTDWSLTGFTDGNYIWNALTTETNNISDWGVNRTFLIDTIPPSITITSPLNVYNWVDEGYSLDLNWTVSDNLIDSCWYDYNGTIQNISCSINTTKILWEKDNENLIFYANDSVGNVQTKIQSWNYNIWENNITYNSVALEGSTESFILDINYNSTLYTNIIGNLYYNNTKYLGTNTGEGNNAIFISPITLPIIANSTNNTFYWEIVLINSSYNYFNSSIYNQIVNPLRIDNCSSYGILLFNFSLMDEKLQTVIPETTVYNTTVKVNLDILNYDNLKTIKKYSKEYLLNNNPQICLKNDLSNSKYKLNMKISYDGEEYSSENYNIQKGTLQNSSLPQNINLYDLKDSEAQTFKIIFKDTNFLPLEDALIQIQREYIEEGQFKTIEIPITDYEGETIASLVIDNILYTLIVIKDGVILSTFNKVLAKCQNPTFEDCEISLNNFATRVETIDYTNLEDFTFTTSTNQLTREIETLFSIPSGLCSDIEMNVTLFDGIGGTQVCYDSLTSTSGTLNCIIPSNYGNQTFIVELTKDEEKIGGFYSKFKDKTPIEQYGSILIFLNLFLILTLLGIGVQDNPMITGVFLLLGAIIGLGLNLISGGFGTGATILWLIIALVIIMIKGAKR